MKEKVFTYTKNCTVCGIEYTPRSGNQLYCKNHDPRKKRVHPPRICSFCSESFTPKRADSIFCQKCKADRAIQRSSEWYYANHEINKLEHKKQSRKFCAENPVLKLFRGRRSGAKEKGIEFSILKEDLVVPEICPVLKTSFQRNTPYAMSIDRIDPHQGYVKGNVQIISRKANVMKNNATREELLKFADWIYANYKS